MSLPALPPGSIAFLDRENRILVAGDGVQDGVIYMFGPQRNLMAYIHSLEKLAALSQHFDLVYPSHAHCPVKAGILPGLVAGAKKLAANELAGAQYFPDDPSVQVYDLGPAKILYNPDW